MIVLAAVIAVLIVAPTFFFGEQAVRLLREAWDGVIRSDPQGNIRPHGAQLLAEELFTMLDDNIPQTQNAPTTMNAQPNTTPLTINNPLGGNAITLDGGSFQVQGGGGINMAGGQFQVTDGGMTIQNGNMNLNNGFYLWDGVPLSRTPGAAAGTTTFLGKVVSGTGTSYTVGLYGNGSPQPATATVTVTCPQLDSGQQIPAGTWVAPVFQFTNKDSTGKNVVTYEYQPPIWLI